MAELLATHGLHVSCGRYNIRALDCESFTFENEGFEGQWSLEGKAATSEVLMCDARQVSAALPLAGVRHYIELCDAVQTPLAYHHNWLDDDSGASIAPISTNGQP